MQLVNFNLSWNEYWSIFVRRLGALIILQIFLYITYRYYKMFSLLKKVKIMSILCDEEIIPFFCFTTMSFFHFNCLPVEKENDNSGIRNRKIYCKMDLYAQYKMQLFLPYIIYESVKNSKKETKNIFLNIEDIDFTIVNNELRKRDDFSLPSRVYIQNSGKEIDEFDRACDAYEMIHDYLIDNYFFNSTIVHSHTKYEMYHYMNYMNARTLRDLFTVDKLDRLMSEDRKYKLRYTLPTFCLFFDDVQEILDILPTYKNMKEDKEIAISFSDQMKKNPLRFYWFKTFIVYKYVHK